MSYILVHYHHVKVKRQGRNFTEGTVRTVGLWLVRLQDMSERHHFQVCDMQEAVQQGRSTADGCVTG